MQLRSGRSVDASTSSKSTHPMTMRTMRRNSRNYEEFDERRRYQAEQRAVEEEIYTSEEEIVETKKKQIYATIKHKIHAIEYQRINKDKYSFYDVVDTCVELFTFINNNMPFIATNNAFPEKLAKVVVDRGNHILTEIHRKDKTRAQAKKFERCRYYIGNVIDLIEHYILRRF
jgi:hypothetical protein